MAEKKKTETALTKRQKAGNKVAQKDQAKRQALDAVTYFQGLPTVQTDVDVANRLSMFFDRCRETGEAPTVEKMCLALGTYYVKVSEWEHNRRLRPGMSQSTTEMIRKAKQMIAAYDAEMVMNGQLNATAYFFRSKNYYGMKDQVEQVITSKDTEQTYEDLEKRYGEVIDVEAKDVTDQAKEEKQAEYTQKNPS